MLRLSCLEIFNEKIFDLLQPGPSAERQDKIITNKGEIWKMIAVLNSTRKSPTSHSVYRIVCFHPKCQLTLQIIESKETQNPNSSVLVAALTLVFVGGLQNVYSSLPGIKQSKTSSNKIDPSAVTFCNVLFSLKSEIPSVPYHQSELTKLIQHSLGGNSKTAILLTIDTSVEAQQETRSVLDVVLQAKDIYNTPTINEVPYQKTFFYGIKKAIDDLAYV